MSNVHPWFANVSVQNAANWTEQFFQQTNVDLAETLPNKPQMSIAETGGYCAYYIPSFLLTFPSNWQAGPPCVMTYFWCRFLPNLHL
jgi:hypothetical protein